MASYTSPWNSPLAGFTGDMRNVGDMLFSQKVDVTPLKTTPSTIGVNPIFAQWESEDAANVAKAMAMFQPKLNLNSGYSQSPAVPQSKKTADTAFTDAQKAVQQKVDPTTIANQTDLVSDILSTKLQEDFTKNLEATIPGYKQIIGQMSKNVQSMMSGKLPQDVQDQIGQMTAEKNLKGGRYGGVAGNLTARDLGLTSLDLSQKGQQSAKELLDLVTTRLMPPQIDPTKMYSEIQSGQISASGQTIALSQQAQQAYQYQSSQDVDQQLSEWNKNFEAYSLKMNEMLSQQEIAMKNANASTASSVYSQNRSNYFI